MAYIRFSDTTDRGTESDVYIYQVVGNEYILHVWEIANKEIENLPKKATEEWLQEYNPGNGWQTYRYETLDDLIEDMEQFDECINVPEILFERLERQKSQDIDAGYWASEFHSHYKRDSYPLEEEEPVFSDVEPHERNGLRLYVERIAPMLNDIITEEINSVWNDREHLIHETLEVLVRDAGVDEAKLEVNWHTSTIMDNARAVCDGSDPEYDTFLDGKNEIYFRGT